MTKYQQMYYILCAAVSKTLDCLPQIEKNEEARQLLQTALDEAEELYIQSADASDEVKEETAANVFTKLRSVWDALDNDPNQP